MNRLLADDSFEIPSLICFLKAGDRIFLKCLLQQYFGDVLRVNYFEQTWVPLDKQ